MPGIAEPKPGYRLPTAWEVNRLLGREFGRSRGLTLNGVTQLTTSRYAIQIDAETEAPTQLGSVRVRR